MKNQTANLPLQWLHGFNDLDRLEYKEGKEKLQKFFGGKRLRARLVSVFIELWDYLLRHNNKCSFILIRK